MGLFEPAWKKILSASPQSFRDFVGGWDREVSSELSKRRISSHAQDQCKNVIYGLLAINSARLSRDWTPQASAIAVREVDAAVRRLTNEAHVDAIYMATSLWAEILMLTAWPNGMSGTSDKPPPDAKSEETAVDLTSASDVDAATAGISRLLGGVEGFSMNSISKTSLKDVFEIEGTTYEYGLGKKSAFFVKAKSQPDLQRVRKMAHFSLA